MLACRAALRLAVQQATAVVPRQAAGRCHGYQWRAVHALASVSMPRRPYNEMDGWSLGTDDLGRTGDVAVEDALETMSKKEMTDQYMNLRSLMSDEESAV